MRYQHTNRQGLLLGCIDFCTAGLFFLLYMPLGGLQNELEEILGHKLQPYRVAYLWGIPTAFIYTLVWMARIAEELKAKAIEIGIDGPHTSWWHMFGWNINRSVGSGDRLNQSQESILPDFYPIFARTSSLF